MGPVLQLRDVGYSMTTEVVMDMRPVVRGGAVPPTEFYDDLDPEVISHIRARADEVLAGEEYELVDGYDDGQ